MKASISSTAFLCLLVIPLLVRAQEEMAEPPEPPGFLMFNQNRVPTEHMDDLIERVDSLVKPVLDGMADEGLITNWGILRHSWGDDWNWNWYIFTKDHAAFVTAWSEFVNRALAADSTAFGAILEFITDHKDNFYTVRHFKGREPAEGETPPGFLMLNQHQVMLKDLNAANALGDSTSAKVLDDMVDDGTIHFWGQVNHDWGDEWSYNYYIGSEDHADFVSDWNEFVSRMQDQHPAAFDEFAKYSKAHRDNLYNIYYAK